MDGYSQIIFMPRYLKKILFPIIIISVFSVLTFLGTNYGKKYLASFSGIITAWVTINPLEVRVSAPAEVEINKVFKVEARLINKGEEKIENAKAKIFLPSGLILMKKDPVQEIGVIPAKKEKKASWAVKGIEPGSHIVIVSASGELKGDLVSAEDSVEVRVREPLREIPPPKWFQNLLDFFREMFRF